MWLFGVNRIVCSYEMMNAQGLSWDRETFPALSQATRTGLAGNAFATTSALAAIVAALAVAKPKISKDPEVDLSGIVVLD